MPTVNDPDGEPQRVIEGRAQADATTRTELEHASQAHREGYSWSSGTYDMGVNDTILLVKNNSAQDLHIIIAWLSTDVDTRVVIHSPTVVFTGAGTAVVGVNLNKRGANLLTTDVTVAEAWRDETGNAQGDIWWSGEIMAAANPYPVILQGAVILAKGDSIGVDYVADAAAVDVTLMGHFGD